MSKQAKVCVIGCLGKTGQVVSRGIMASRPYRLAAGIDMAQVGSDLGEALGASHLGVPISNNLPTTLAQEEIDFAIDFTNADAAVTNIALCLQSRVPVLVGTTGLPAEDLEKLHNLATKMNTPVLVVPNFAIGALLMMEFARIASKYMAQAEIIEMHHPQKLDKPSGTAARTRDVMLAARVDKQGHAIESDETMIPIHSVRLPGLIAHQMVIFGDVGQSLTIRHDSFSRESFIPGVLLGLAQLPQCEGLQIGLRL